MRKPISVKQLASYANVSVATVSRVLNHKGGYSEMTAEKIWDVASKLGYLEQEKNIEKSERKKLKMIGIVVPDLMNEYFSRLISEFQAFFKEVDYRVLAVNFNDDKEMLATYISALNNMSLSGLILVSGSFQIEGNNKPTVFVDRDIGKVAKNACFVESDNVHGGYLMTKELIDSGCRRIAFITDLFEESSKVDRFRGYSKALEEANLPINPSLIKTVKKVNIENTYELMMQTLREPLLVDGVFCTTDVIAVGAMAAIKDFGKKIPEDISVGGYDDINLAKLVSPQLTTIRQNQTEIVREAGTMLLELIDGHLSQVKQLKIPIKLVKRSSTKSK